MLSMDHAINDNRDVLHHVKDGFLIIHQKYSGSYVLLKNYIDSLHEEWRGKDDLDHINFYSLNDEHPLYHGFIDNYPIQNLPALMVIHNGAILNVVNGPITSFELSTQLELLIWTREKTQKDKSKVHTKKDNIRPMFGNETTD